MCDFKPGDELVYIGDAGRDASDPHHKIRKLYGVLVVGSVYVVEAVIENPYVAGDFGVVVQGVRSPHRTGAFTVHAFRKVQRRDLSAWLETKSTIEEPKRKKVSA